MTYTLECTTVFTATVPKSDVYRISTVLGETNPEKPDYRAEATIQLSEMEDGRLPVLRMAETVPDLG